MGHRKPKGNGTRGVELDKIGTEKPKREEEPRKKTMKKCWCYSKKE